MRYAKFDNTKSTEFSNITKMINLGESIIPLAVDELLRYSGIPKENVDTIPYYGRCELRGGHRLIIAGHFGRQYEMDFMNNADVQPVFISFGIKDYVLTPTEISYFKKNEPILCRDEFTKNVMQSYDIEAYVSGCVTLLFKQENKDSGKKKYYFVDVKEEFMNYVPQNIKENSVITSQNIHVSEVNDKIMEWGEKCAVERLAEYSRKAKMVITSKLHCMTPCVALGIPTIAVGNNFSYRYSFIDAFIDSYNLDAFKKFDWQIPSPNNNLEQIKKLFLSVGRSMLLGNPDMEQIKKLDMFYTNRKKWNYLDGMRNQLAEIYDKIQNKQFILWGASSGGYSVVSCIRTNWPNWKAVAIIDSYAEGCFAGIEISRPEEMIERFPHTVIIVSTLSGMSAAEAYMKKYNRISGRDYFVVHESF